MGVINRQGGDLTIPGVAFRGRKIYELLAVPDWGRGKQLGRVEAGAIGRHEGPVRKGRWTVALDATYSVLSASPFFRIRVMVRDLNGQKGAQTPPLHKMVGDPQKPYW